MNCELRRFVARSKVGAGQLSPAQLQCFSIYFFFVMYCRGEFPGAELGSATKDLKMQWKHIKNAKARDPENALEIH